MKQALFSPMLAAKPKDKGQGINAAIENAILFSAFPVMGSPKLDGIRCTVQNGKLYSRTLKLIPNLEMQERWGFDEFNGLDGEITVGNPHAGDVFNKTTSVVMSRDAAMDTAVFRVFDKFCACCVFEKRHVTMRKTLKRYNNLDVVPVEHVYLRTVKEVRAYEEKMVALGYEGVMLRNPYGKYKQNRSTLQEGGLVAIKRFVDAEAQILSVFEMQHNGNAAVANELGRTKRSSAKAGMVGLGTLGGFTVQMLTGTGNLTGPEFNIGTGVGLTADFRRHLWEKRKGLKGKIVKFKFQAVGTMTAPRLPIFLGFRDRRDT